MAAQLIAGWGHGDEWADVALLHYFHQNRQYLVFAGAELLPMLNRILAERDDTLARKSCEIVVSIAEVLCKRRSPQLLKLTEYLKMHTEAGSGLKKEAITALLAINSHVFLAPLKAG